jgi:hypothetical protein
MPPQWKKKVLKQRGLIETSKGTFTKNLSDKPIEQLQKRNLPLPNKYVFIGGSFSDITSAATDINGKYTRW